MAEPATSNTFMILGLTLFAVLLFGFIYYVDYLRKRDKVDKDDKHYNAFFRAAFFTLFIVALMGAFELFGLFPKGTNKKWFWVYLLLFVGILLWHYFDIWIHKPYSLQKQKEIVMKALRVFYDLEEYSGDGCISFLVVYKVTKEYGGEIGNFLVTLMLNGETKTKYLAKINIYYPGNAVHLQENPPQAEVDRFTGAQTMATKFETLEKQSIERQDAVPV